MQPEHLKAFYTHLEAEGLSSTTALLHHRVISRALKVAMQRGRVARTVATLVDAPTARREEVQPLDGGTQRHGVLGTQWHTVRTASRRKSRGSTL